MKELLVMYALNFIGVPYKWGGSNPISGFDCSGLVQEALASVGLHPPTDMTAQQMYEYYKKLGWFEGIEKGAIVFFGKSLDQICHVAIAINDTHMIEAGGGSSKVNYRAFADQYNAFVRVRPIKHRNDFLVALNFK